MSESSERGKAEGSTQERPGILFIILALIAIGGAVVRIIWATSHKSSLSSDVMERAPAESQVTGQGTHKISPSPDARGLADGVDSTTLLYLAAAAIFFRFNEIKRLGVGGNSVEFRELRNQFETVKSEFKTVRREVETVGSEVKTVGSKAENAEKIATLALPGAVGGGKLADGGLAAVGRSTIRNADPEKGLWGGKSVDHGRRLWARVETLTKDYFRVHLQVESTSFAVPLTGKVTFHLHPTFRRSVRVVEVNSGIAVVDVVAYGAFTVGAETDKGNLELDLADLPDAPKEFRDR